MIELTLMQIKQKLENKEFSSKELVEFYLKRIEAFNPKINAFLEVYGDEALKKASEADSARASGAEFGPLAGIPMAVKDNICYMGKTSSCGSKILASYKASYTATALQRLVNAGAIVIGRTNMDEFAMGSSTENSAFGVTKNPWDISRVPGGSSGGSVAAVCARLVPFALGSETGGSVRQPASLCGVTGLKPTYGRVSRYGLVSLASSLDQISPATITAEDSALIMQYMEGADPLDATSKVIPEAPVAELLDKNIKGLKIGVPKEYFIDGMDPEIESAVKNCAKEYEKAGAIIEEISMPHTKYALPVYYILMPAEASSNLARFDGIRYGKREDAESLLELYSKNRGLGFGPEPKRRIILGTYVLSAGYIDAYYNKALAVRELIKQDFKNAFAKVDLLLTPSSPSVAWKIGEKSEDPVAMYLSDIYTVSANLAGVPAISVPCGFTKNGLPMGLQFTARHFEEEKLYDAGAWLQAKTDFHLKVPQL